MPVRLKIEAADSQAASKSCLAKLKKVALLALEGGAGNSPWGIIPPSAISSNDFVPLR